MKAVVAAFNQEKALVGAFSVITNLRMELFQALLENNPITVIDIDLAAETWRAETVLSTLTRMWSSQISEWLAQLLRVSTTDSAEKVHCMLMSLNAQIQSFIWRHAARQMDVPGKPRWRNIYAHVWYLELRSSPLWNNNIRIFPIPGLTLTWKKHESSRPILYLTSNNIQWILI